MNWLRDFIDKVKNSDAEKQSGAGGEGGQAGIVEDNEPFDPVGETAEDDLPDGKKTLQFGFNQHGGQPSVVGYCAVKKRGVVEACQWQISRAPNNQGFPRFKIKF